MSIIPPFQLGLWNAWIFMVPALLITFLSIQMMGKKGAPSKKVKHTCTKSTLLIASLSKLTFFPATIYSFFLPLKIGTTWFYVGLPITLIGLFGYLLVFIDWYNTPAGEPVTRGIYRYSRHPMYVTMVLLFLGVSIISVSLVFLLFTVITGVGVTRPYFVKMEEAITLGHYGSIYLEYMNRTPRWLGIPKLKKE
jgi:protein-S-isoprenylcysteine O-methyltransferase Ste14